MKKKREYDDDDGRTIADMSDVETPSGFIGGGFRNKASNSSPEDTSHHEIPHIEMSNKDRRIWIFAAMKAGLLVAFSYIIGAVLLIGLILLLGYSAIR